MFIYNIDFPQYAWICFSKTPHATKIDWLKRQNSKSSFNFTKYVSQPNGMFVIKSPINYNPQSRQDLQRESESIRRGCSFVYNWSFVASWSTWAVNPSFSRLSMEKPFVWHLLCCICVCVCLFVSNGQWINHLIARHCLFDPRLSL